MIILRKNGFTLIELIIVIAIMGIMTAIAVPGFRTFMDHRRLNGAARMVMSDLMAARMQAVSQNNWYRVFFVSNNPAYQILDDTDNDGTIDSGETVVTKNIQSEFPGVTIVSAPVNPIFHPRGTAPVGATITLNNASGFRYVIVALTGRVRISDTPP